MSIQLFVELEYHISTNISNYYPIFYLAQIGMQKCPGKMSGEYLGKNAGKTSEEMSGSPCRKIKSLRVAVMIFATLVNTHIVRHRESFWPAMLLAQPGELKNKECYKKITAAKYKVSFERPNRIETKIEHWQ